MSAVYMTGAQYLAGRRLGEKRTRISIVRCILLSSVVFDKSAATFLTLVHRPYMSGNIGPIECTVHIMLACDPCVPPLFVLANSQIPTVAFVRMGTVIVISPSVRYNVVHVAALLTDVLSIARLKFAGMGQATIYQQAMSICGSVDCLVLSRFNQIVRICVYSNLFGSYAKSTSQQ